MGDKDNLKFIRAKAGLLFCPTCKKDLECHPLNATAVSCFVHGDFLLLWIDGDLVVQWKPMQMESK